MKDYHVTVTIQFQGMVADFRFIEEGYDEQDAKDNAEERVVSNMLIYTSECEEIVVDLV